MGAVAALVVGGVAALVGAGISAWSSSSGQKKALREARRTEKLNIKFAEEETEREQERFQRGFKKKQASDNYAITQSVLDGLQNMYQTNVRMSQQIGDYNRRRQ